jgi:hypothetical protein
LGTFGAKPDNILISQTEVEQNAVAVALVFDLSEADASGPVAVSNGRVYSTFSAAALSLAVAIFFTSTEAGPNGNACWQGCRRDTQVTR